MINNAWVFKPTKVKQEVHRFFKDRFAEDMKLRPGLICHDLKVLDALDSSELVKPFELKEIKDAVFDCGSDKAPGPDGFNFRFIKRFWHLFEDDFLSIMHNFADGGVISRGVGSSFITLIPKVNDPVNLGEYRPITLIGVISKVLSKILANRIKVVMGKITHETQSAFLSGRYILDGPLIISEIFSWAKKQGKKFFFFKIDFEKAYDNVNWEFLLSVMRQMNFLDRWCNWIKGILVSARSSVLVNGAPTFEFNCEKGIRQGDPLSPFLFIIVMEAFSSMIRKACASGAFDGVRFPNGQFTVSHLLYADDAMVMGEWSDFNFIALKRVLRLFHLVSGLRINLAKSTLFGVGKNMEEVESKAVGLGCRPGSTPFKYLGILVGANMNRINNWEANVEVFKRRLSRWKATIMSIAGRLTLISSVLESLPSYYFALYKAPKTVIDKLEAIMRRFLWGGSEDRNKIHWVAWEEVTKPKDEGGLGINKLEDCNNALILKWLWRYRVEPEALCTKVIDAIHLSSRSWELIPYKKSIPGVWSKIVSLGSQIKRQGKSFINIIRAKVGNGKKIRSWIDPWIEDCSLKDLYPDLFRLEQDKFCLVDDRFDRLDQRNVVKWCWRSYPESAAEVQQLLLLHKSLTDVMLSNRADEWVWSFGSNLIVSVKDTRKWLKVDSSISNGLVFKWCSWIPNKCNIFMWRALRDRIPTTKALLRRNVNVGEDVCRLCGDSEETLTGVKKEMVYGILIVSCWRIWKARNDKAFSNIAPDVVKIVADVKALGFLWYKSRYKKDTVDWKRWCHFNFDVN
ncbi:putative RNA-directed DNA polymerase [Helianthus annuus]|uniref:RNA-directed DNA polymerase n=1 Tax=Helianthus annuus TaxID=4232 RepID=A0A9K3DGX0_HELAN|nr:putative RNA-directed DNA polymerase [Helianthus annuus]KAJ0431522.1 putative RNA-directed DNA polymerase [Helianthus annuus]KAJ0445973.1 putative RNA-directed DNA polymerase [Helianthus annuus]KAJ0630938.1 putative RNA-directed DNA polymerase [Helianthus annuus]KAJ0634789.1 putative RNA-directed DNA polymerase [Helianthus annuus]